MKITNFRNLRKLSLTEYVADVDVQYKRFLLFTVKETRQVFSQSCGLYWRWFDSGDIMPGSVGENLYMAYRITEKLSNEY